MSDRRTFLKTGLAASLGLSGASYAKNYPTTPAPKSNKAFRILHMTDMHIRPEHDAPRRYTRIMKEALKSAGKIDLVLNGGDSIYAADYNHIKKGRVLEQWKIWDDTIMPPLKGIEILHALGNHDMWWATAKTDPMYGKDYVLQRLGQKERYTSIERGGWLIITLDCNNAGLLDDEQLNWLHAEMKRLPDTPMLVMSHQPILLVSDVIKSGLNKRQKQIINPFVDGKTHARPVHFISGHVHILDTLAYNNVSFHCNGAFSGAWWEENIYAKDCSYQGTPMGYSIIDIYPDGQFVNQYHDITDCKDGKIIK
ncbi:hypothetical protein NT6N_21170 [Oceaniferula spumae]|uniref:Calcineurin-like phosphoesterase domain-containing protein n=1 Tax=Oceaniferula spumae TaxID=2979115 RepID=A0AAT9FM88_9BACT